MDRAYRVSVPIDEKMHQRLQKAFPWGTQAEAIRRVLEILLTAIEKDGYNTIHRLISGKYKPLEGLPKAKEDEQR